MDVFLKTIVAGFTLGVFVSSVFPLDDILIPIVFSFFSFFILVISFFLRKKTFFLFCGLFGFSLALGTFYFISSSPKIINFIPQKIIFDGYVSEEPDERENNVRLVIESEEYGRTMVYAKKYPSFFYGDRVVIEGLLKKPKGFLDDRGEFFDWPAYLAKDGINSEMIYPKIEKAEGFSGSFFIRKLLEFKNLFVRSLRANIPEPEASLSSGVTIGARGSLPYEMENDFRISGLSHIVVVSGYNVSLVADYISRLVNFFSVRASFLFGFLGVVAFTFITGASATVVRASIMASLILVARKTGRMYAAPRALCIAGFLMILENPRLLVFDLSFQLSFLATLGIMLCSKPLEERFYKLPNFLGIREIASSTLSAQIFVSPLLAYKIGMVSFSGIIANLLVLITVPFLMFSSALTGLLGIFSEILSLPFAYVSYMVSHYIIAVSHYTALIPYGSTILEDFSLSLMVLIYIIILSGLFFLIKLNKKQGSQQDEQ